MNPDNQQKDKDQPIPKFRSWNGWYVALVSLLILEIILFGIITQHFS